MPDTVGNDYRLSIEYDISYLFKDFNARNLNIKQRDYLKKIVPLKNKQKS